MHVLNQVQDVDIQISQPFHHIVILMHNLIIIQIFTGNRTIFRTDLCFRLFINSTVNCIQQTFCKVSTCSEELHFLTCLRGTHTAAYRIVIPPYRAHNIIILILYGACLNRDACGICLEAFRQMRGIQHRQIRLRCRSHIFQCMQETEVGFCNHMATIHTQTCQIQCSPYRVTGEQLVIRRNTCKFHHTELHRHMIDQLLCFTFGKNSCLQITFDINIQEGGNTSDTHCSTVLCLDGRKITEIQPLNCLLRGCSRSADIKAVKCSHRLHTL